MTTALDMAERDERINWRARAVCRSEDPELFFPTAESGLARARQVAAAKAVCRRCPVRPECLSWALSNPDPGIWGGTDEKERREIRRGRS